MKRLFALAALPVVVFGWRGRAYAWPIAGGFRGWVFACRFDRAFHRRPGPESEADPIG